MKRVLKKNSIVIAKLLLLFFAFAVNINSQTVSKTEIPHVIAFQGVISEKDGSNIPDGIYDVHFALFDVQEGGSPIWAEDYSGLKIENGILSVLLGRKNKSNLIGFKFDRKLYLDVTINSEVNIYKRIELGGTAYSLGSAYTEEVDDSSITTVKFADEAVTNDKIESVSFSKLDDINPDPYSVYWTILGNIIFGPERNYVGTIEKKDFVLKTFSIERMRFTPTGRVTLGTPTDTVDFTVIGKTKFQDTFIKGNLGVGVMPGAAKVHIDSPGIVPSDIIPFKVDVDDQKRFQVSQNGKVEIISSVYGDDEDRNAYPLFLNSKEQGIGIKVKGSSDNDNNFVSFWNEKGMQGRIEGESYVNYLADPVNIMRDLYIAATVAADVAAFAAAPIEAASMIAFSAEVIFNAVDIAFEHANLGVTYESASGDYAEWLERNDQTETMLPGEIVGIYDGKVSKNTNDADQLSCISFAPIVLGNTPTTAKLNQFEKVAFIGQVPIKVLGTVKRGDYIIPSGLNDGVGIAVSPEMMTINEYLKVVGRAWAESNEVGTKYVNTAIGFDNREIIKIIQIQNQKKQDLNLALEKAEKKIKIAKTRLSELNNDVEKIQTELKKRNERILNAASKL